MNNETYDTLTNHLDKVVSIERDNYNGGIGCNLHGKLQYDGDGDNWSVVHDQGYWGVATVDFRVKDVQDIFMGSMLCISLK
jgi:hypothetical protein